MPAYKFVEWRDEVGNVWTTPSISLLIDRDKTLTAYYEEVPAPPVTYILTVATTSGGNTNPPPASYEYDEGATALVTALPQAGYNFSHWTLDGTTRTENPVSITMNKNYALTAYFEAIPPPEYTLNISAMAGGTTSPAPGTYRYMSGISVTVTAIPSAGYAFDHWLLDGIAYTSNPITVLMNQNHALTAYFSEIPPPTHILTVNSTPITGVPFTINGISKSTPYTEALQEASYTVVMPSNVQVDADIYNFKSWEDGSTNPTRVINLISDRNIVATYELYTPPSPTKGNLQIHAFYQGQEVSAIGSVNGISITSTPVTLELDPKAYTITLTYMGKTQTKSTTVIEDQTIREDVEIAPPPPPVSPIVRVVMPFAIGIGLCWLSRGK